MELEQFGNAFGRAPPKSALCGDAERRWNDLAGRLDAADSSGDPVGYVHEPQIQLGFGAQLQMGQPRKVFDIVTSTRHWQVNPIE